MKIRLTTVASLAEALELAPRLDGWAAEFWRPFSDEPFPRGASERVLRKHFGADESVLVTARAEPDGELYGACHVGPFEDPLTLARLPMVLTLYVEPPVRHRGVARELVSEARRVLEGRGIRALCARAGHNDDALISMGERWGFVRAWELMVRE